MDWFDTLSGPELVYVAKILGVRTSRWQVIFMSAQSKARLAETLRAAAKKRFGGYAAILAALGIDAEEQVD